MYKRDQIQLWTSCRGKVGKRIRGLAYKKRNSVINYSIIGGPKIPLQFERKVSLSIACPNSIYRLRG